MFSPRLLAALAVLAVVAALPTTPSAPQPVTTITDEDFENPWISFPLFGNLFAPLWKLFPSFAEIGPRIVSDDEKFQVVVSVKDYKTSDLKVKVRGDFIIIQGSHEAKQDAHDIFASQFFHTYSLPANASSADVTAELTKDGNLIVTAPINGAAPDDNETDREVPIVETDKTFKAEEEKTTTAVPTTTVEDKKEPTTILADRKEPTTTVEDKREPTTPVPDREEVTEKDNIIPHGNEITP